MKPHENGAFFCNFIDTEHVINLGALQSFRFDSTVLWE